MLIRVTLVRFWSEQLGWLLVPGGVREHWISMAERSNRTRCLERHSGHSLTNNNNHNNTTLALRTTRSMSCVCVKVVVPTKPPQFSFWIWGEKDDRKWRISSNRPAGSVTVSQKIKNWIKCCLFPCKNIHDVSYCVLFSKKMKCN